KCSIFASQWKVSSVELGKSDDQSRYLGCADGRGRDLRLETRYADGSTQHRSQRVQCAVLARREVSGLQLESDRNLRGVGQTVFWSRWAVADLVGRRNRSGLVARETGALLQFAQRADHGRVLSD